MRVTVRVTPRAARNAVGPYEDGVLRVRVTAAPVDGKATVAVCRLLAEALGVPRRAVRVVSGDTARTKILEIDGADEDALRRAAGGA
jgi:uncharacterized protein YggU (UPF0235/DUF167 family)